MKTRPHELTNLGDLVATVFDVASRYTADPAEVARLASTVVRRILRGARRIFPVATRFADLPLAKCRPPDLAENAAT